MKRLILTSFLSILTCLCIFAEEKYIYTQISQKEGLTSTVNSICKEKNGDVWIGTQNGLYSFDGHSLKNHNTLTYDSRRVFHVNVDANGDLWVLTDRHILKKRCDADTFQKVTADNDTTKGPFYCIKKDKSGLWIGGETAIYRYRYEEDKLTLFCSTEGILDCRSMDLLTPTTLLCCSHRGKIIVDLNSGEISEAEFDCAPEITATIVDRHGRIWFGLYNNGIEVFSKDGKKLRSYNTADSSLNNNIVLCLTERDSIILAGTDGGGINVIDFDNDRTHAISHISGDPSSFPANSIKSIYVDDYKKIWAGSIRDGLINISQSDIITYHDTHLGLSNGLSNPTVLCLHQDRDSDIIWIGTDGEGLNSFCPSTARFKHIKSTLKTKVVSIADYSETELIISTYGDNIWVFDKISETIRPLPINDKDILHNIKHSGRSFNLINEEDGDLLLLSNSVFRYDKRNGNCHKINNDQRANPKTNLFIIGRNRQGVWFHNDTELYVLPDDGDTLLYKGVHKHGQIRSGFLEGDHQIWLATGEGLCRFDPTTCRFNHVKTSVFEDITSVVCDNNSRVWLGSEYGLLVYTPDSNTFSILGKSDGASPNEYLPKPRLLAANGDVYLGGVQGLLHIDADYKIYTEEEPELRLSTVTLAGKEVNIPASHVLEIPYETSPICIDISTHERDIFRNRVYRFEISGQAYLETTTPQLHLQNLLKIGRHDITVSCIKRDGTWTQPVRILTIDVFPPWYSTWWFILSCTLVGMVSLLTVIITINKRKERRLKEELQKQKEKVYEEKVQMLINVSHELRTPLTLIMAPLKRLLKDTENEDIHVLSRIYRQSRRMRNILDMVLDLRKMEVGINTLRPEKVDFNSWIAESVEDIVNEEKAVGIDIVYDFDPAVGSADIDRQKCHIVMMNILINAIKHSSTGDTITIRTSLQEGDIIRISISDQGPGLAKDIDPAKMFTRFYQSNSERYGSGIGLSYSKILVEMHGGTIGVWNNPDKGATFWWEIPSSAKDVTLPAEPRAFLNELLGHSSEAEDVSPVEDDFSTSGMRLMIVDDSQDLLDFLREGLCQDFAEIISVTGGNKALKELSSGKLPDIIVSDVNMPDGDGFSLCREIKQSEKFSHIPVVLLTARGEDQSQSESYKLGADGFLAKPFDLETLMELIRSLLRNKAEIRRRYLDNESSAAAEYGSNEERFIIQLNRIISEHLSDPDLDQQLICRELGVSRALLYNKMKAITGAGTKEYIIKIRIEKAKTLIESTALTIAEISDMTGFASQSYFSTAFKNYTGKTPSQYKQQTKSNKDVNQ